MSAAGKQKFSKKFSKKTVAKAKIQGSATGTAPTSSAAGKHKFPRKTVARSLGKLHLELPFPSSDGGADTEMIMTLGGVDLQATIREVKVLIEKDLGILRDAYSLCYLDNAPLEEDSRLCDHEVVEGASLRMKVWRIRAKLLRAAISGDITDCFSTSIDITGSSDWSKYCAWTVLYTATHQGHHHLVAELLRRVPQLPINKKTDSGWTVLHAAARMGRWKVLCMLVDNGAHVKIMDNNDQSAIDMSRTYKHKNCENSLNFCHWNLQKHWNMQERKLEHDVANERRSSIRLSFQASDSSYKNDMRGPHGQIYAAQTPNPISIAKVRMFEKERKLTEYKRARLQVKLEEDERVSDAGGKLKFKYGWFDALRAQQLIPCTRDIIRYSDPSSCKLRPRSLANPRGYKVPLTSSLPHLKDKNKEVDRATKVSFDLGIYSKQQPAAQAHFLS